MIHSLEKRRGVVAKVLVAVSLVVLATIAWLAWPHARSTTGNLTRSGEPEACEAAPAPVVPPAQEPSPNIQAAPPTIVTGSTVPADQCG